MFSNPQVPLSNQMPMPESSVGAAGAIQAAAKGDHQHPRLTSAGRVLLNSSGLATVTYTRTFANKPAISLIPINPSGKQVILEVLNDIQDGSGNYIGCNIKGSRTQALPGLTGILLIGPLITALSGFDVLGASAAGVEVSVIAVQQS